MTRTAPWTTADTPCCAESRVDPAGAGTRLARSWVPLVLVCLAVWLVLRVVFFIGFAGSDDLRHVRFALLWDRTPVNHWEARLLANGLIGAAIRICGFHEWSAALPTALASLATLGSVLHFAWRRGDWKTGWWAGLAVATLPAAVTEATSVTAYALMLGWAAAGAVAWLDAPTSRVARGGAALCLALTVLTHESAVYYVAALLAAGLLLAPRTYWWSTLVVLGACAGAVLAEFAAFHLLFGDAWGHVRVCRAALPIEPTIPLLIEGRFNWRFATWPLECLVYSKSFGVLLGAVLISAAWRFRRLSPAERMLFVSALLYWVWTSYGSRVPWEYRPFSRLERYLEPLMPALAILFATGVARARRPVLATAGAAAVLGLGLFNLSASGSWGQNVEISRELLEHARQNPSTQFLTDYRTLNEMYILSGLQSPPNVATLDVPPWRLLDTRGRRLSAAEIPDDARILHNPINARGSAGFAAWLVAHRGPVQFETAPTYRPLCRVAPFLRNHAWAVRKPAAQVAAYRPEMNTAGESGVACGASQCR